MGLRTSTATEAPRLFRRAALTPTGQVAAGAPHRGPSARLEPAGWPTAPGSPAHSRGTQSGGVGGHPRAPGLGVAAAAAAPLGPAAALLRAALPDGRRSSRCCRRARPPHRAEPAGNLGLLRASRSGSPQPWRRRGVRSARAAHAASGWSAVPSLAAATSRLRELGPAATQRQAGDSRERPIGAPPMEPPARGGGWRGTSG